MYVMHGIFHTDKHFKLAVHRHIDDLYQNVCAHLLSKGVELVDPASL